MKKQTWIFTLVLFVLLSAVLSCGTSKKIQTVQTKQLSAYLALSRNELAEERKVINSGDRDTLVIKDDEGKEFILMKAIRDEETGEMVANEVIDAAVITAKFRNVAERHGKVDLRFEVIVPQEMIDTKWQLVFNPDMFILEDSIRLEPVIITGEDFRKKQVRGYEAYDKYLKSIITDSTAFVDWRNVNVWISRNLPDLYRYKNDTSFVDLEEFHSRFGPTERDAILHYTLWSKKRHHEKMWYERGHKFEELVKVPIRKTGIKLDTVLRDVQGNFVFQYTQTIKTRPKLRKVDVVLSGDIYEQDQHLYSMPRSEPLTFYISSLSAFVDNTERYMTKIIERRASANTACYVDFAQGKSDIDMSLGHNEEEMGRIRGNIRELLNNTTFDIDSIVIAASASPEGTTKANGLLAEKRAASVANYFQDYIRHYRDSVRKNSFALEVDENGRERVVHTEVPNISFSSHSAGENWPYLTVLVDEDSVLTQADKFNFMKKLEIADVDAREKEMQPEPYYKYMRENLYPRLRTTKFSFFLSRRNMQKDTIHTTVLDSTYMQGVQYLRDREYEKALTLLRDYRDYNTAIAYVSLDYNASAMAILQELKKTPQVNYMLALLYARNNDDQKAVQHYMDACKQEHSYVFRGNLDPEIYVLIQRYGLNKQEDEEF